MEWKQSFINLTSTQDTSVVSITLANFLQGKQIFVNLSTVITFVTSGFLK